MGKRQPKEEKVWTEKALATNRKAKFLYHIDEKVEAGIVLVGSEVKSLRSGQASLTEAFAIPKKDELWLMNLHIPPYEQAGSYRPEPVRPRKLLLHRREIEKLSGAVSRKGVTLVPLRIYIARRRVKVEIGVCRGKKAHDKREAIKERDLKRSGEREFRVR
jgi:SsrA-binding protein